jgi:hypothetical protein
MHRRRITTLIHPIFCTEGQQEELGNSVNSLLSQYVAYKKNPRVGREAFVD